MLPPRRSSWAAARRGIGSGSRTASAKAGADYECATAERRPATPS